MRIPITMCHGANTIPQSPLDVEHFTSCSQIAYGMAFESISYDQVFAWMEGGEEDAATAVADGRGNDTWSA